MVIGLAIVAGVAAWAVGEAGLDHFQPSAAAASQAYSFAAVNKETERTNALNGAMIFGAFGGLLGLAMGLGGGLARRSAAGAIVGGIIGLLLGAAAGALPAFILMPWQWRHRNDDPSATQILVPLLLHFGLWAGLGLTAGIAFSVGNGRFKGLRLLEAGVAGLAGAMLGTFIFEMIGAILFPLGGTLLPISATPETRLIARLCVAVFVALGAIRCLPKTDTAAPPRMA